MPSRATKLIANHVTLTRPGRYFPDVTLRRATNCAVRAWRHLDTKILLVWTGVISTALVLASAATAQNALISPAGQHETVTLACNPFPPSKIANNNSLPGYDVEVLRAAFMSRNITLITPFYPWKRAYFLAETGQVDGLCSCSYLPEREADFLYSDILGQVRIALYSTRAEVLEPIEKLEDATKMNIGVVNGYSLEATAREANLDVVIANSELTLVNLLMSRRLDAALSFTAPMDYLLNVGEKAIADANKIKKKVIANNPYYSCISKKSERAEVLLEQLNIGLKAIRDNGVYDSILEKYGITSDASKFLPDQSQ